MSQVSQGTKHTYSLQYRTRHADSEPLRNRRRQRRRAIVRLALSSGHRKRRLDSRQVNLLHHWREELTPARARALIEALDVEEAAAMKAAAAKEAAAMKEQKFK